METWQLFFKKKKLATVRVHKTLFAKCKGLMFSPPLKNQEGIILVSQKEDLSAIHMFFVFFPIDVLWLDRNCKVIHKAEQAQPFTSSIAPPKKAQYIVELKAGATKQIKRTETLIIKKPI